MPRIMSYQEINDVKQKLDKYSKLIQEGKEALETIIKSFESDQTVESFFVSGKFGKNNEEKLIQLKKAIEEYEQSITASGGLYSTTNSFLEEQLERLDRGI